MGHKFENKPVIEYLITKKHRALSSHFTNFDSYSITHIEANRTRCSLDELTGVNLLRSAILNIGSASFFDLLLFLLFFVS